MSPEEKNEIFR